MNTVIIRKIINEGQSIPFWYGKIGYAPAYMGFEFAPIPINYLYKLWHWILHQTKITDEEKKIAELQKISYDKGYREGYANAYKKGHQEAYAEGWRAAFDFIKRRFKETGKK